MSSDATLETKYEGCPVIKTLEEVGSRWRMTVIHVLREGELRFNELKRATDANSQTLSRVLTDLEEKEYVERRVDEGSPVAVYYSLTPKGEELLPPTARHRDRGDLVTPAKRQIVPDYLR